MIDTDKYDNEGIELSDGGTICFPESDGRIERIDKDGNTIEVRYQSNHEGQEWYELFDTRKALLTEVKRYKQVFDRAIECALNDNAEQAMQFLLNMDYCLDDEEKVTDKNRHKYTWVNGEWRNEE